MTTKLHITIAQLNPIVGDLDGNLHLIRQVLDKVPVETDLVIFPELFLTGYPPEDLILKSSFLLAVEEAVYALAKDIGQTYILLSCPWREKGKTYNAIHLIGDGKIQETRFKHHLPNYGVFDEARVFTPGPLPTPLSFKGHHLGVMICEDAWYSDVAASLKMQGADCLIVVNASPFELGKLEQRHKIAHDRASETHLPLIYVNMVGGQDEMVFDGASFILNEHGNCILRAEEFANDIVSTVWEKAPTGHWLCSTGDLKRHREEPELIYQAVVTGLRDYVIKNGFPGVLVGMSGGIDSALSAAIAADALGPALVHCIMMPSKYTSKDSLDDAAACSAALGVSHDTISIIDTVITLERELSHHFTPQTPDITHQNIQSRVRGVMLMALSNANGKMVLSTGNKSEMATGYATLYGDMCGGFNALKDIYKTDVYKMAEWRNAHKPDHAFGPSGHVIPARILTKAPTAELKPDQTDQDSLPPYDILDTILKGLIEQDLDPAILAAAGLDLDMVIKVQSMLHRAEYKRRQSPPGVKITARSFGRERRYPMTHKFKE